MTWSAEPVGALAPSLVHEGKSSLAPEVFLGELRDHLQDAPVGWDPFRSS